MPKFGDVVLSLAGKAGIFKDEASLKQLLSLPDMANFELPDHVASALEQRLLTVDSAVANQDVRAKIYAEALNGVDEKVNLMLNDFEFDEVFKGEVKGVKNSYDKLTKVSVGLKDQLKAAKEKANKSGNSVDKLEVTALQNQIAEANQQMENLKRSHAAEKDQLIASNLNEKKEFTIKSILSGKPLPTNKLPKKVNILSAKFLLEEDMAKKDLVLKFDESGNPILRQRKDGAEVEFYENNKKVDLESYVDGVLAHNNFLQINDQSSQTSQGGPGNTGSQSSNNNPVNQSILAESKAKMAELGMAV